jgi:hypothetical protein
MLLTSALKRKTNQLSSFGMAIGMQVSYSSNILLGENYRERIAFLDEVDSYLLKYSWELLFQMHRNICSVINFLQNVWRVRLFYEPKFPSFKEIDFDIKMTTFEPTKGINQ